MKRLFLTLAIFSLFANLYSQCAFDNVLVGPAVTPSCPGTTQVTLTSGQYMMVDVIAGVDYSFTTCGLTGCDTQISLYNAAGTTVLGYNDDACGLQTIVNWTATYTGQAALLLDQYYCSNGCVSSINITCTGTPPPPPCGTPVVFNYNGGIQNYTVPAGVTSITVVAAGGAGGGTDGGQGAQVQFTIPVTPGNIIGMNIGGMGGCPNAGYNGGGASFASTDGFTPYDGCGGGGATNVTVNGSLVAVAGAGGGGGGGSTTGNGGGDGGCAIGAPGGNTFGAGGGGGSQVSAGIGGAPWAGTPPGGSNGVGSSGGVGGVWQTASGGGGGGGYFGGGGGGNDGCCTGGNGGGGGGGGSSLVPGGGGCTQGVNFGNGVVTIYIPTPNTMTSANTATICSGGTVNIPLTSTLAGSTFTWIATDNVNVTGESTTLQNTSTLNNTLTNSTGVAQTVTYTVTPYQGICIGTPQTVTVTVTPPPVITAEPDLTFCAGASVPLNSFVSTPAGATFTWTNSNTAIGLAASGTGSVPAFTATNATAAPITSTITVTPTLGCTGPVDVYTITVNPLPVITAEPDLTFCAGAAVPLNSFVSTPAGATFAWTNSNTAIGLAASGTVSVPAFTATNATAAAITSTITVTPSLGTCVGPVDVYTITVNPVPVITAEPDLTFCSGVAVPINAFISTPAGATFTWTNSNTGIGLAASGTGGLPAFTATNATALPIVGTITVTPTIGPCVGPVDVFTITINPTPTVTDPADQTLCAGAPTSAVNFTGTAGTTFNWTNTNTAIGLAASGTGNIASFTTINATAAPITATITVTPVLGPCTGTPQTFTITVNPVPVVTAEPDLTFCAGAAVPLNSFVSTPAGATFAWTNSNAAIGLAASGTVSVPAFTATNATALPIVGTITVTPTLGTCVGPVEAYTITVNPTPTVTDPADQTICAGGPTNAVNFTGTAGTTFNWTNSNTTIGLAASGTGNIASFTAINVTAAPIASTITVTPVLGPCTGTPQTFTITVNPNPVIAVSGVSPTTCGGTNGTITITGLAASTAYNVSYTDDGTPVGPVSLTSNGAGAITITGLNAGSYTNFVVALGACTSTSATVVALIDPAAPTVTDPADQTICAGTNTTAVNFTGTAGATFNWTNSATSIGLAASGTGNIAAFPGVNAGVAPVVATITVTPSLAGCVGTPQTFTITVNPIPSVTDPADQSLCANATTNAVNFTGAIAGTTFNWTNSNTTIGLGAGGTGNIAAFTALNPTPGTTATATITVTPVLNGCSGTPQTFTISVINTLPTLTSPGNLTAVCSITEQPAYANFAAFTGAGGSANSIGGVIQTATFTLVSEVSNGGTCPEIVTRTYSIQDNCGSTATCTQTITIDDNINPTGTAPANITVQCIANVPASNIALITDEADNCAVPTVTFISDVSNGGTCPEIITRTYRITDACGNFIDVTQTITIDDTTNPTASNPASITVPGGPVPVADPTVVIDEADNCSVPVVAFVSDVSDGNLCPETITRTYSVTDACGNQIFVTQTILITDPILPTASNPAPISVQCAALVPASDITVVTDEADNNGAPTVAFVSDVSNGGTCPEIITRTYSVTDPCGNVINVTQTITVDDTTNPTASNPAPITVQCIGDVPASNTAVVTDEADNCTVTPVVAFVSDLSNGATCPEIITRSYSVTDACGNQILVTQTITVDDTTNPTASNPAAVTVQCIGDIPASDPTVVTDEADNCSVPVVVFVSDVSNGATCPEIITRTYSVTDACGNQIMVTQTITVDDTTNPTASNPAGVTVDIIANVPVPNPTVVTDEADNCSVPVVAFVSDVSDGNTCPETITRTYSVTDACGNQITVTQTIIVSDLIMPTASNPAPITVQCIALVPASDPLVVTDEADNNGVPVVAFVSDVSNGGTCPEIITRTYSVTDACTNQILVTQTITVDDTTNPTATNPAPVTVQCIGDVPASNTAVVTDEADNCSVPVVAFVSDVSNGATCPEIITRTYSVTDACGNQILVTQTITVDDTTNPTASNPAPVTVQCIGDVPAANASVISDEADNCSTPVVAFVSDVSNGATCPEIITRTYSVTDACGNQILVTQTITVDDITNPTATNPAAINVTCASAVPAPNIAVVTDETDNCTAAPLVAFVSDVSDGNVCNNETITRTYSVTDNCGNSITVTQQIIIGVTTPAVSAGPDQAICEGEQVTLTATNPDGASLTWDNGVTNGVAFTPSVGTATYTATVTQCGGECFASDQVNVTVNPLPVVSFISDSLAGCAPFTTSFDNLSSPVGNNCTWNFGSGAAIGCGTVTNTFMNAGTYNVTLTVTTLEGCTASVTYPNYITVVPYPEAEFSFAPQEVFVDNPDVEFTNSSTNADNYSWTFGDGTGSLQENPSHTYPQVGNMTYTVQLIATNSVGCADTISTTVEIQDVIIFYVPNVFTPDGDGTNNTFLPVFTSGFDIYDYHLTIFNRWGEVVFESYNSTVGWSGTYGDQGLVDDGVYVWQIEFGDNRSDKRHKHRGHVTVLK